MTTKNSGKWIQMAGWGAGFGTTVVVMIYFGLKLGIYFDRFFDVSPWGLITGVIIGLVIPFYSAFRFLDRLDAEKKETHKED